VSGETRLACGGVHYRVPPTSQCLRLSTTERGHEVKKHCCKALLDFQVTVCSKISLIY